MPVTIVGERGEPQGAIRHQDSEIWYLKDAAKNEALKKLLFSEVLIESLKIILMCRYLSSN